MFCIIFFSKSSHSGKSMTYYPSQHTTTTAGAHNYGYEVNEGMECSVYNSTYTVSIRYRTFLSTHMFMNFVPDFQPNYYHT